MTHASDLLFVINERKEPAILPEVPSVAPELSSLRWRAWPCEKCRGGITAIGYLNRCHEADGALPSLAQNELIDHVTALERAWLSNWIASCEHSRAFSETLPILGEGSEHLVFFYESTGDVIKVTKPGIYGDIYYLEDGRMAQANSTPGEYLIRTRLVTKQFGLAWTALGLTEAGQFVSRQRFVAGDPPTQLEVDQFLVSAGLSPIRQQFWLWKGVESYGLEPWVGDTRADNFVRTENGIVPIDLRMWIVGADSPIR